MNQEVEAAEQVEPVELWAVTKGEYSDFDVRALFVDEEDAEAAKETGLGDAVCNFWLYPKSAQPPQRTVLYRASARLAPGGSLSGIGIVEDGWTSGNWDAEDGSVHVVEEVVWVMPDTKLPGRPEVQVDRRNSGGVTFGTTNCLSREAVVKAVSDRVAKQKAEWLEAQVST